MYFIRTAAAIAILVIFTGCQQAYQSSVTPVQGSDTEISGKDSSNRMYGSNDALPLSPDHTSTVEHTRTGISITRSLPSDPVMTSEALETGPQKTETGPAESSTFAQIKTDQALELCNLAQEMWEAGRLDDALSYLDDAYSLILEMDSELCEDFSQQKDDIRFLISKRILEIYASRQVVVAGSHDEIPITLNDHVKAEIERLTGPQKNFFINSLQRSSRFRPYIVAQLKSAGLPEELSWLPLIESGYQLRALSSARALGLWQFIPSTGHKFGLIRNQFIDERMDPEKSTRAAIAYLKELHNLFGDWTTVLAAYNCGEGRVLRTIRDQRINYLDNFWDLYQSLPRETAQYVPRFLATLHIIQNLDTYGISIENPLQPIPYKTFEMQKQVRLTDIAKEIQVDTDDLRALNPELRYDLLPPDPYQLKIPESKAAQFLARLEKIKTTYAAPQLVVHHKIRSGETLSSIATRYRTSVDAIARANNLRTTHRIIAGKVLKIPGSGSGSRASAAAPSTSKNQAPVQYTVQKGDSLWGIARKFSTTTTQIMAGNNLSATTLHVGQTLTITASQKASSATSVYYVKSGDSPFLIAKKHKMGLNRLLALNRLSKSSTIYPGQKLIVE